MKPQPKFLTSIRALIKEYEKPENRRKLTDRQKDILWRPMIPAIPLPKITKMKEGKYKVENKRIAYKVNQAKYFFFYYGHWWRSDFTTKDPFKTKNVGTI